jgi:phi13 family phage major tail protein
MARIKLNTLYYALCSKDDSTGVTYGTPVHIPGVITCSIKPDAKSVTLYADDAPAEVANSLGEITVDFEVKDLPLADQAALLGGTVTKGVLTSKGSDSAPYVALMFKSEKASGATRYVKLLKGKFAAPEDSYETEKDSPSFQTDKLSGKFVARTYDSEWKRTADTDAEGYEAATGTAWFTSVEPTA